MKRHGGLRWAVVNVLFFREIRLLAQIVGKLGCGMQFESFIDGRFLAASLSGEKMVK